MSEREPQSADKYIVRFPEGLRQRLKDAAQANNRTLNAEIVLRLQQSFEGQKRERPADLAAQEQQLHRLMSERAALSSEVHSLHVRLEILRLRKDQAPSEADRDYIRAELDSLQKHLASLEYARERTEREIAAVRSEMHQ